MTAAQQSNVHFPLQLYCTAYLILQLSAHDHARASTYEVALRLAVAQHSLQATFQQHTNRYTMPWPNGTPVKGIASKKACISKHTSKVLNVRLRTNSLHLQNAKMQVNNMEGQGRL